MMIASSPAIPLHLILPSCSAAVYVFAALFLKRASELGGDVWRTTRVCNFAAALVFCPLLLFGGAIPAAGLLWQPALVAMLFVAGQVLTVLSLRIGDVSVATPVMGLKIIFVAFLTTLIVQEPLTARLWIAAVLSSAARSVLADIHSPSATCGADTTPSNGMRTSCSLRVALTEDADAPLSGGGATFKPF